MHQRLYGFRHEAVDNEEIFLHAELRKTAFQIAGPIILHAMAQDQILRASWGADRVGLDEA
jgi:hypothetical protein